MEDLELNKPKLPAYESIDVSVQPSRRRRLVYFVSVLALVLTFVAVTVYVATPTTVTGTDAPANAEGGKSAKIANACPLTAGTTTSRSITVGGKSREYKVIASAQIAFPSSAIFAYHGISSTTDTIEGKMLLAPSAPTALLVYPEAKNKGGNGFLDPAAFNGAGCCKNSADFNDEETFAAIVDELAGLECIDATRVFAMGFSNGGFMTHRLACAEASRDKVRAACVHSGLIGDYSGTLANSPWNVCQPKDIMAIHGTSDGTVPFAGGKNPLGSARWYSFEDTMAIWKVGCEETIESIEGSKTIQTSTCPTHQVTTIVHADFGHEWHTSATRDCLNFFDAHGGL